MTRAYGHPDSPAGHLLGTDTQNSSCWWAHVTAQEGDPHGSHPGEPIFDWGGEESHKSQ